MTHAQPESPGAGDDDFDGLFTPDRVAELERIAAEMRAGGRTYTIVEIREEFEARRESRVVAATGRAITPGETDAARIGGHDDTDY